ncbi:MAG: hypothetical protein P4L84_25390 [Isosphaeraceae bacterium]|nr:hypothetical protein [Isosphaeraceae bacterium]
MLEQRVARAHRMGQRRPVQVYVLVTEQTIEENLIAMLAAKKDLALAALDVESDVDRVDLASGMQELKSRLEVLLGAKPDAPVDETVKEQTEKATRTLRRERVSAAGGELLGAAFKFLGELVSQHDSVAPPEALVTNLKACVEPDPSGEPRLTITLPEAGALEGPAQALAKLLAAGGVRAV